MPARNKRVGLFSCYCLELPDVAVLVGLSATEEQANERARIPAPLGRMRLTSFGWSTLDE